MISNIDIARDKLNIYRSEEYSRIIASKTAALALFDNEAIRSSSFSKTMAKIVKIYESGAITFRMHLLPFKKRKYRPRYRELIMRKFNSYDFRCVLLFDYATREFFFKLR